ncbi:hypothetical protein B0E47_01875 [Rhodanobacter sp. B05]|uniref:hypothetical protein n=1 Tax=Rhodanobacter sp. B05 TaxID=1945859 RepID=UPI000987C6FD|nr:hypothetical protein [Rhodanobacter sp. B05]OOG60910.1 hypothetical protein B0E47_01875 [Rhodanobacter sp. B05]
MRGVRCLALSFAWFVLATPAWAGKVPTGQPVHTTPSKAAKARDAAQLAFQRDLVSVLAPRADAMPLLGAALLARPLFNQPPSNSFHALIERAAQAEGNGPAVSWVRLADCDAKADACPNPDALAALLKQAPDNAAVWLVKLGVDARDRKEDAAREDLHNAATAKIYDDYAGTSLKALADSVGVLPPPADTFDPTHAAGAVGMQTVLIFGLASTQPQPSMQLVAKLCENAGKDDSIKADCLSLGKLLEWGSSPLARSLGLHLREVLSDDPAGQQEAKDARRTLIWQVQNFNQLLARIQNDSALARHLLSLARNGGTEMSLQLAALRDDNIAVDPPVDWQPRKAE